MIFNWRLFPELDAHGQISTVLSLSRDVTEQRRAEQDYQTLFQQMLDGFALNEMIFDAAGQPVDYRFLRVNPAFEQLTGLRAETITGKTALELFPQTEPFWIQTYGQVVLTGEPVRFENYTQTVDKHFEVVAFRPRPGQFAYIFQDVSQRKKAEALLRRSEARYRYIFEAAAVSLWEEDITELRAALNQLREQGVADFRAYLDEHPEFVSQAVQMIKVVDVNTATLRLYGANSKAELLGSLDSVTPLEALPHFKEQLIAIAEQQPYFERETFGCTLSGQVIDILVQITLPPPEFNILLVSLTDMSERKRAERALRQSEERFRSYFELSLVGVAITSVGKRWLEVNDKLCDILGYDRAALLQTSWTVLTHPDDLAANLAFNERILAGAIESFSMEKRYIRRDGQIVYTELWVRGVRRPDGSLDYLVALVQDISARKQAESALRTSLQTSADIVQAIPSGLFIYQYEPPDRLVLLEVNPAAEHLTGITAREWVGKEFNEIWPQARVVGVTQAYLKVMHSGQMFEAEDLVYADNRLNGAFRIHAFAMPANRLGVAFEDVTKRKQAEQALKQSEATLKSVFRAAPVGIGLIVNRTFVWFNETFQQLVGYAVEEMVGQSTQIVYSDEAEFIRAGQKKYAQIARSGMGTVETRFKHKNGRIIDVLVSSALLDPADLTAGVTFAVLDITGRKQAEQEIRRRNRELSLLNRVIAASALAQTPEALLEVTCQELAQTFEAPQVVAALINEARSEARVVAEHAAAGQLSVLNATFSLQNWPALDGLLKLRKPLLLEDARRDSRLAHIGPLLERRGIASVLLLPLVIDDTVVGSLSLNSPAPRHFSPVEIDLAWNVAGQVAAALARSRLAETRRLLMTAIEQTPESVVITDLEARIIYVNPTFEQITGYSRAEVLGQNPRVLKSYQHDPAFYRNFWDTLTGGQVWQGRLINKKKDGSLYTEEAIIAPVRDERGAIINYIAIKRDVTQELRLEEQYRQAQRMEPVGRLAGGVAHDFNNILTVIGGYTDLLLTRSFGADDPRRKDIEQIQQAAQRAGRLTRQLLAFSRQQTMKPEIFNLNTVVINLEKMLRRVIGEDVELVTELAPDLWQIKTDPGQMEQVLMNLVVNARDAMPRGGRLTLTTANLELEISQAINYPGLKPDSYVMLRVTDTGVGMDVETRSHIFEPFFTTKSASKGTGLGLATVYGIVQQSDGQIYVDSTPGLGAAFSIYLPATTVQVGPPAPRFAISTSETGKVTILLVEDEAPVQLVTRKILEIQGHTVLVADGPARALEICQQYSGQIDLLITDVIMPKGSGPELASRLKQLYPQIKVLFISGYTNEALTEYGLKTEQVALLEKPFSSESLAYRIRQVLNS